MLAHLTLYEDVLSSGAAALLPSAARMIFVVHGAVSIGEQRLGNGDSWHGEAEVVLKGGEKSGAMAWRFDFTTGSWAAVLVRRACGLASSSPPSWTLPESEHLRRGDSVAFPPGGCAFTHVHQVPGIRRIIEGGIRIHTQGRSTAYGPGGAWFENGVEPVFAQAAPDRPSRFTRLKILTRTHSW